MHLGIVEYKINQLSTEWVKILGSSAPTWPISDGKGFDAELIYWTFGYTPTNTLRSDTSNGRFYLKIYLLEWQQKNLKYDQTLDSVLEPFLQSDLLYLSNTYII